MNMTQKELPAILHGTYQRWRDPWDRVSDIALRMILGGHQLVGIWIRPPRPIQTVLGRHRALWSLSWNLLFQSKPSPLLPFERRKRFRREPLFCFPPRPAFDVSGRPRFPAKARPLGARRSPPRQSPGANPSGNAPSPSPRGPGGRRWPTGAPEGARPGGKLPPPPRRGAPAQLRSAPPGAAAVAPGPALLGGRGPRSGNGGAPAAGAAGYRGAPPSPALPTPVRLCYSR